MELEHSLFFLQNEHKAPDPAKLAMVEAEKMDRCTDACKAHLKSAAKLDIRQTRKGWFKECLGCEQKTELNYFSADKTQIATSVEDTDCFCRMCCTTIHPFKMSVNEMGTQSELLTVDRPLSLCGVGSCKCCCFQTAEVSSGGKALAIIREGFYFCVPIFNVLDGSSGEPIYKIHPPTCCGGMCIACCAEGLCNFKFPFWVFDANQENTDGPDAERVGKILKLPKSLATELFTDADAFEVEFPEKATVDEKAALVGTAIFLNAAYFEKQKDKGDDIAGAIL